MEDEVADMVVEVEKGHTTRPDRDRPPGILSRAVSLFCDDIDVRNNYIRIRIKTMLGDTDTYIPSLLLLVWPWSSPV